nr:hypothetical protein [Campylobacter jejuni]
MKLKNTTISEDLERWIEAYLKHIQALSYSNNTFLLYRCIFRSCRIFFRLSR